MMGLSAAARACAGARWAAAKITQVSTLHDVARLAGVSVATASAVLSGRAVTRRIAHGTAERVRAAALSVRYQPNAAARALVKGSSRIIAFAVMEINVDVLTAPYSGMMAAGVLHRAQHHGYSAMVMGGPSGGYLDQAIGAVEARTCDGVVVIGALIPPGVQEVLQSHPRVPCVVIEPVAGELVPRVSMRWDEGFIAGIADLVAHGHRRGWWLEAIGLHKWIAERRELVLRLAAAQGLMLEPLRIDKLVGDDRTLTKEAPALLHSRPAVVACNDANALILLRASAQAGMQVPRDFSVLGTDAVQSQHCVPQIGSVDHCYAQLGMDAVDLLLEIIQAPDALPMAERQRQVVARYVPGDSVAPPPA